MPLDFKTRLKSSDFDPRVIVKRMDRQIARAYRRMGSFIWRTSRSSIKKARQKKLGEMTDEEREHYEMLKAIGKAKGFKAKKPLAHSAPGETPRSITGKIKNLIRFDYDDRARSLVVGPILGGRRTGAPETLEYSGHTHGSGGDRVRVEARPYMRPAMEKELPQLPRLLKG
jgi:hypothetical protein